MHRSTLALTAGVVLLIAGISDAQTTRPRAGNHRTAATISKAVRELQGEYQAYLRGGSGRVRTSSNYFIENPSEHITDAAILAAIEKKIADDGRVAAYVKWQLLSGLAGSFEAEHVARAAAVYRNAPALEQLPGMNQSTRSELELLARNSWEDDIAELNRTIAQRHLRVQQSNAPVIAFRDEMFDKLAGSYDGLSAAMEDAYERLSAGAETEELLDSILSRAHDWMITADPTPRQLRDLSTAARTLAKQRGSEYYDSARWSERSRKVIWSRKTPTLKADSRLESLARELAGAADTASAELASKSKQKSKEDQ